ncbi:hypothetical protein [Streptomyces sp. CS014]|uniref:hypothetical protein n=1 Tax=Streptomyces sp. CS014 TaxID=2162707 RepID=UPI000D52545D|nr:hypothetical protein [Streptomyces sp. CS014]PVD01317.1 hypothetical protein DBP12_07310 [Streptomyces sp. CS014]
MTDTTPDRPADQLHAVLTAAVVETMLPRYGAPQHNTPGGLSLTATAEEIRLHRARPIVEAVLTVLPAPALAVARQLLGTTEGDECGKTVGVSGLFYRPCARPAGHPEAYCRDASGDHMFLAAATPAAPPAPADRAAVLREAAEVARQLGDDMGQIAAPGARLVADRLRRLAGEAAAGAHQTEARTRIADALADADGWKWAPGFKSSSPTYEGYLRQADVALAALAAPAVPAAPEETR